jgi:aspartate/methionine/tyrosine aminotransferase
MSALPGYRLANRVEHVSAFQVMELVKRASRMEQAGHPVIHMSIGEPDFTAPPAVVQALEVATRAGRSQYTPAVGIAELREAISRHYADHFDVHVEPSRIIVTAGASAALSLACCALVNPGDGVLMTDPGYPCNRHFVTAHDGVAQLIGVGPESGFQLTADSISEHWSATTRGVLLASPSNPTGTSIPFETLRHILDEVRARGGFSIVDEIYLGLSYGTGAARPARSVLELGDDMIVTNSFSKYFNMTGWRLGWLVVPPALVSVFEKLAQNLYICASALAQHAALACFTPESMAIYEERRETFRQRRDSLIPQLRAAGLKVPVVPDGAFYVYADCSASGLPSDQFADRLLDTAHVSLVPGQDFGSFEPARYVRLSYATALPKIDEAMQRLKHFMQAL